MAATAKSSKKATPEDVDAYLADMPNDARAMLEELRSIIRAAAPDAAEGISYGMPVFRHHGNLLYMGGYKNHCSLFGIGSAALEQFGDELANHRTPKGTLHFPIGSPVPAGLVSRLVKACVEENEKRAGR